MADERKYDRESAALRALGPQIKPAPKHFWEVFPDYSLSEDFGANAKALATLKECYEPKAVSLRMLFLWQAGRETEALAKNYDGIWPVSIAQDLFNTVGSEYEAHLRNCSLPDLRLFVDYKREEPLVKLSAFFKPRGEFSPQAWDTMTALLSKVWEWARARRLDHYSYVHFACLALIEGHWIYFPDPTPPRATPNRDFSRAIVPPALLHPFYDPRQDADFIKHRAPDVGWSQAISLFDYPAMNEWHTRIKVAPEGCWRYSAAIFNKDAESKRQAQAKYAQRHAALARQAIDTTVLACLKERYPKLLEDVVGAVEAVAREYSQDVDQTPVARFPWDYENAIKVTVARVILRREWNDIATDKTVKIKKTARRDISKSGSGRVTPRTTIESIVKRTANDLYLPKESYRGRA